MRDSMRLETWVAILVKGLGSVLALILMGSALAVPAGPPVHPGSELWVARYQGTPVRNIAYSVAVAPDGSAVFVTGTSDGEGTDHDFATIAYGAATGSRIWARRYDGPSSSEDYADSLVVSPDGSKVFVAGTSWGTHSDDAVTIAYRIADGTRLWVRRVGQPGYQDYARSLAVSPDGARVFTTGTSERNGGHARFTTVAFRSATGRRIWTRRYEGPAGSYDSVDAIGVDPGGKRVYVTGNEELADGTEDYATIAYRASTGNVVWERRYGAPPFSEDPLGLVVGRDGSSFFIVGTGPGEDGSHGFVASYRTTDGRRMWTSRFDGPCYSAENGIGLSADGSQLYVIGSGVVAFKTRTGARLWTERFGGATGTYRSATALAVSRRDPRVYVTGESLRKGRGIGYLTVAYRGRTGARLWSRRYKAPSSSDGALAVAVSPDGTGVFVTGYSTGTGQDESYATVAYAA